MDLIIKVRSTLLEKTSPRLLTVKNVSLLLLFCGFQLKILLIYLLTKMGQKLQFNYTKTRQTHSPKMISVDYKHYKNTVFLGTRIYMNRSFKTTPFFPFHNKITNSILPYPLHKGKGESIRERMKGLSHPRRISYFF